MKFKPVVRTLCQRSCTKTLDSSNLLDLFLTQRFLMLRFCCYLLEIMGLHEQSQ